MKTLKHHWADVTTQNGHTFDAAAANTLCQYWKTKNGYIDLIYTAYLYRRCQDIYLNMAATTLFSVAHENEQCPIDSKTRKPVYSRFQGIQLKIRTILLKLIKSR